MIIFFLFILGLIFGSFLNVVIFRYEPEKSVFCLENKKGRSYCPHCKKSLTWVELIPVVSFIIQAGKCRGCAKKISWQYPLVEILSGLIFASVPLFILDLFSEVSGVSQFLPHALAVFWTVIFLVWLLIAFIDKKWFIVPDELNLALGALGAGVVGVKFLIGGPIFESKTSFLGESSFWMIENLFLNHFFAALIGALFFTAFVVLSKGKAMGWGDAKLAFVGGFALGWPEIAVALAFGFIIGGIFGSLVLLAGKKRFGDHIPFAPFIVAGMAITVFFGSDILGWYFGLIGL